jgi:endonuclease YncB( thermonuclease family)
MSRSWHGRYRGAYTRPPHRSPFRKFLDYALTIAIFALLLLIAARLDRVETLPAGAAIVHDGDTLTLGRERVRLRGIDAPEYTQICVRNGANYACGQTSREALARLVGGKAVSCSGSERDRYGRLLGSCVAGGVDLNRTQVMNGWAIAYGGYVEEEDQARRKRLGLWAGSFDRPRNWRDNHRGKIEGEQGRVGVYGGNLDRLRQIFRFY